MRLFSQSWSAEGITISSIFKCLLSAEDSNFVKLRFPLDRRLRYFLPQSIFSTALREKGNAVNEKSILYKLLNWRKFMSLQPIINRFSSLIELIINFFSVSESQKTIYCYFTTEKRFVTACKFSFCCSTVFTVCLFEHFLQNKYASTETFYDDLYLLKCQFIGVAFALPRKKYYHRLLYHFDNCNAS